MNCIIRPYVSAANEVTKTVMEYMYGINGDMRQIPKKERLIQQTDLLGCLFVKMTNAGEAGDRTSDATVALLSMFTRENEHYSHIEGQEEEEDDGENDDSDHGEESWAY